MPEPPARQRSAPERAASPGAAAVAQRRAQERCDLLLIGVLTIAAAGCAALFLTVGVSGNVAYIVGRRSGTLVALAVVAAAVACSTVVFQTITENRILTPSIMGFDAMYVLLQTTVAYTLGASGLSLLGPLGQFWLELGIMLAGSVLLYGSLLAGRVPIFRLLLVGVVLGLLFRGLSSFMQQLLTPDAFLVVQDRLFARFTGVQSELLVPAVLLTGAAIGLLLFDVRRYDVMSLGRDTATGLGVDPARLRLRALVATAVLVSVSTALVGPVTFFGLLVAHLAYRLVRVSRHASLLPVAALVALIALVGGQALLEHVFKLGTTLSILIEFAGGLLFIFLLLRRRSL